jgi:hypothetical protein
LDRSGVRVLPYGSIDRAVAPPLMRVSAGLCAFICVD